MDTRDEIREELRELSPMLGKMEKKNPFRVPDYYFQNLPDRLMEGVKNSSKPALWTDRIESWLNNFFSLIFQPEYAIPASVVLLTLVVGVNFFKTREQNHFDISQPLSEISSEEISEYVIQNFDDGELMALSIPADQLNGMIPADVASEDLEDYLQNNFDYQTLEEDIL